MPSGHLHSTYGVEHQGITNVRNVYWNHNTPLLYEHIIKNREGNLVHLGPIVVRTGQYTPRAAKDRYVVDEPESRNGLQWHHTHRIMDADAFDALHKRFLAYLEGRDLYVQDCFAGHDPKYRLPMRVITETAWHSLFARNIFIQAKPQELIKHQPDLTVLHAPHFQATPEQDGTSSHAFAILHLSKRLVLIGGTAYAGEIKRAVFTFISYTFPPQSVLPIQCSSNVGTKGDVALFFGACGTGKTTLSADPKRRLIGDDVHGWGEEGVFNLEGGCYAKVMRLAQQSEPELYATVRRFGTVLENVAYDSVTRRLALNDSCLTENTRAAYPNSHMPGALRDGRAGHPRHAFFLTADATGVLPPVARLTLEQAVYFFVSGYTAKLAGTEDGIAEPRPTFSPCFGAPTLTLSPSDYAQRLATLLGEHEVQCWLVNTGWIGGHYGTGTRIELSHTRAFLDAILSGALESAPFEPDSVFGFEIPTECPGVPQELLHPADAWYDLEAYDLEARRLAAQFDENFEQFEDAFSDAIMAAGPRIQ